MARAHTQQEHNKLFLGYVEIGSTDIVRRYLDLGIVDVNTVDNDLSKNTALHIAVSKGHVDITRLLLSKNNIDVNKRAMCRMTPLHILAEVRNFTRNHLTVCNELLEDDRIDVNLTGGPFREIPILHLFAAKGHKEVVRKILETGKADLSMLDHYGRTAESFARQVGHDDIANLIRAHTEPELDVARDAVYALLNNRNIPDPQKTRSFLPKDVAGLVSQFVGRIGVNGACVVIKQ